MSAVLMPPSEDRNHRTFQALMWALSYPGRPQTLPSAGFDAFVAVAHALIDLETSFWTTDDTLVPHLSRTGARRASPETAFYHFYPQLDDAALAAIARAPLGTLLYPDTSATLVIGCTQETPSRLRLTGPGVDTQIEVALGGIPSHFWDLRTQLCRMPLGWDIFFLVNDTVYGVPRSVTVEVL